MIITDKESYVKGSTALAPEIQPNEKKKKDNKREKQLLVKEKNKSAKNKLKIIRNISLTFLIGVTLIGRYSKIYNLQKQLNTINGDITMLNKDNENLKVELVKFSNIQYVEDIATKKLGMVRPTKDSIIYCDMNKEIFKYESNDKTVNKVEDNTFKKVFKELF